MDIEQIDILLVEDNPHDADLAMMALEERNLANNIVWIDDGQEALDFIFAQGKYKDRNIKQSPKLILLDLKMPKVDGLEILREIKSNENTMKIPVVILTSSTEDEDKVKSYKLHVNSFVSKPVDFDEFSKVVSELGFYWMLVNQLP
ncbi:MAG TPA: response regulator [Methanobacterium sp.]|nr:response regulator [Methanobacterium sp.]